jgi:hypothetical protein
VTKLLFRAQPSPNGLYCGQCEHLDHGSCGTWCMLFRCSPGSNDTRCEDCIDSEADYAADAQRSAFRWTIIGFVGAVVVAIVWRLVG